MCGFESHSANSLTNKGFRLSGAWFDNLAGRVLCLSAMNEEAIIKALLAQHAADENADDAQTWLQAGFDAEETEAWLAARCFTVAGAVELEEAGFTPEQAAQLTDAGAGNYNDTIAYKVLRGDLSLAAARRLMTAAFWDD